MNKRKMNKLTRSLARVVVRSGSASQPVSVAVARGFAGKVPAEQGYIPDVDGLVGRARQEAVVRKAFGEELYDRDAPAFFEEGTRENPIPILSVENERIVGVSLPDEAEIRWFTLRKGELAYDPDTNNFFALKQVTEEQVEEWVKQAEAGTLGKH